MFRWGPLISLRGSMARDPEKRRKSNAAYRARLKARKAAQKAIDAAKNLGNNNLAYRIKQTLEEKLAKTYVKAEADPSKRAEALADATDYAKQAQELPTKSDGLAFDTWISQNPYGEQFSGMLHNLFIKQNEGMWNDNDNHTKEEILAAIKEGYGAESVTDAFNQWFNDNQEQINEIINDLDSYDTDEDGYDNISESDMWKLYARMKAMLPSAPIAVDPQFQQFMDY